MILAKTAFWDLTGRRNSDGKKRSKIKKTKELTGPTELEFLPQDIILLSKSMQEKIKS